MILVRLLLFLMIALIGASASKQHETVLMPGFEKGRLLASEDFSGTLTDWLTEGLVKARIDNGRLFFESRDRESENPKGNIWWKKEFAAPFLLEFEYQSVKEHGLSMIFWNASGIDGRDVFSWRRTGRYQEYVNANLAAYHVSFHRFGSGVSNLRKAPGFHLVASAADPVSTDDLRPHKISIASYVGHQFVLVDGRLVHDFLDEGKPCLNANDWNHRLPCDGTGAFHTHGAIGIRHTQRQQAYYDNFKVYRLVAQVNR